MYAIGNDDLPTFARWLRSQPWVLEDGCVHLQVELIEQAVSMNREAFLTHFLAQGPAVLHSRTRPKSRAFLFAFDDGNAHLVPQLTRIWPLPDDLPHAAAAGDFARVKRWFDEAGNPALGDPNQHHGTHSPQRGDSPAQKVLDTTFAWACLTEWLATAERERGKVGTHPDSWKTP